MHTPKGLQAKIPNNPLKGGIER